MYYMYRESLFSVYLVVTTANDTNNYDDSNKNGYWTEEY